MARITVPADHTANLEGLDSGLDDLLSTTRDSVRQAVTAEAYGRLLGRLGAAGRDSGGSSSALEHLGPALEGTGAFIKSLGEMTNGLMGALLQQLTSGKSSGPNSDMFLLLMVLAPMLQGKGGNDNQYLMQMLDQQNRHWEQRYNDLATRYESERGPSGFDRMAHDTMQTVFARHLDATVQPPQSAVSRLREAAQELKELAHEAPALFGGGSEPKEYSAGALRHKELAIEELKVTEPHVTEREKAKASARRWEQGPAIAQQVLDGIGGLIDRAAATFGIGGDGPPPPAPAPVDRAAARAAAAAAMASAAAGGAEG